MTDQAVEDEIRELAFMSLRQYPIYSALLRQIDAARKERDEAIEALRPFSNTFHQTDRRRDEARRNASEIVRRHDERKKGSE
jgi:hypothetical protein